MTTHGDAAGAPALPAVAPAHDPEGPTAGRKPKVREAQLPEPRNPPPGDTSTDMGESVRPEPAGRAALSRLRTTLDSTAYPLVMPSAVEAGRVRAALVSQLDDYLLPRLGRLDAPLLVVVGGSTGAGKSTLVNSLVRAPVSQAGVLRPTTRSPVLVSHPADLAWFRQGELLPGLTRTAESTSDPGALRLVAAPALGAGLAFLDAPDIDSVVDRNRALAAQLLAAADLWLFVTTAARYADAVPWELLTTARLRGTVIALVLDRAPEEAAGEVSAHLREMLDAHDLTAAPLFVLPETTLDGQGLLAEDVVRPLHDWFARLAADASARAAVVRQTLDGALAALGPAVEGLAAAADEQAEAARTLDERVTAAYRTARRAIEDGLRDGHLLRGEVLARWQEFLGTGEFLRSLESRIGRLRDRIVSAVTGRPAPGHHLQAALESQLVTLLRGLAADAAEQAYAAWQAHPAGAALLEPELQQPSADLPERAERVVRDWQHFVLDLVRTEGGDKRVAARGAAYAANGAGLAVMVAVFTTTAFIPTGLEVAVGAGTTVAAQKVLEALFGDQAIRTLAGRARTDLLSRVDALLDAEAARYRARTAAVGLDPEPGAALRRAAADVERAREDLALTAPTPAEAGTP
ncbi:ABC transporter [Krasilnikovia sp. MM14-A1259]|uniref:ABC transporter n=1 Tax=Krasilnikovia sp. MM14-A1259 TaxID=3373539 RepID=UPI00399CAC7E